MQSSANHSLVVVDAAAVVEESKGQICKRLLGSKGVRDIVELSVELSVRNGVDLECSR